MDVMPPHLAQLALEHTIWLRRLALRLARDPEVAEDLLQDTWVRALEHPPAAGGKGSSRAWLATVLRNLARKRWRRNELRRRLEAERAASGSVPSTDDLFAFQRELRLHETLPDSPTRGVIWNGDQRERKPLSWDSLPAFWAAVESGVKNPVRAALVRTLVLTGLRSLDAPVIVWSDIADLDGDAPTLHRPNPKGGPKAAFTVPISAAVADIFRQRHDENAVLFPGSELVFPTVGRDGRVCCIKNCEEDALRPFGYTPHIARHTFASACAEAGVETPATKALLNHRSKDITEHYQKLSLPFLRGELEKVTAFLLEKARAVVEGETEAA